MVFLRMKVSKSLSGTVTNHLPISFTQVQSRAADGDFSSKARCEMDCRVSLSLQAAEGSLISVLRSVEAEHDRHPAGRERACTKSAHETRMSSVTDASFDVFARARPSKIRQPRRQVRLEMTFPENKVNCKKAAFKHCLATVKGLIQCTFSWPS